MERDAAPMPIDLPDPDRPLRIGTRGSPLALAQAHETRGPADGRARPARGGLRDRGDQDHRRPRARPAAVGDRRQGPVHPRDRGGAARGRDRHRGAFDEGHADAAARRPRRSPATCRARTCATPSSRSAAARSPPCRAGAVVGTSSLRRRAQLRHRRPDLARGRVPRQRADPDEEARGGRRRRHLPRDGGPAPARDGRTSPTAPDRARRDAAGRGAGLHRHRAAPRRRPRRRPARGDPRRRRPGIGWRPSAPSCSASTAPARPRSPASPSSTATGLRLRGEILRPDGSERLTCDLTGAIADGAAIGAAAAADLRSRAAADFFAV